MLLASACRRAGCPRPLTGLHGPQLTQIRTAKKAAVKKGAAIASAKPAEVVDSNTVQGLNILQNGSDPVLRPDEEYPDWLWTIHEPLPSVSSLQARVVAEGADALTDFEKTRMIKQWNRHRIRESNNEKKKQ